MVGGASVWTELCCALKVKVEKCEMVCLVAVVMEELCELLNEVIVTLRSVRKQDRLTPST